ncbi:hypothetical protein [Microbispora sp. NPDC049125]|uniref:hypothetical protein n=1 Tax=Microbispora sp. NPDC049125 TaxID=3154929 RepID=UPI0034668790
MDAATEEAMTMKACEYTRYGGPDVLRLVERPAPVVGPDDVIIQVRAVGLNPADVLQRAGAFRFASVSR